MFRFEEFPTGDRLTWEKLIQKELGTLPSGRPHPFYMRSDVTDWEHRQPLWQESGWRLVSDAYVPEEVEVWRYQEPIPQPTPPNWFIPRGTSLPDPPYAQEVEIFQEVTAEQLPEPLIGTPVWHLPLQLTEELEWKNADSLRSIPLRAPLHVCLTLTERFFSSILLLRALRKALTEKGLDQLLIWTTPAPHLLDISPNLPHAGPEENLIRLTNYALSAILGGGRYIYIPAIHKGDVHAERWSRNISHILRYEVAYLFTTPDPCAGSFFIEAETDRLADHLSAFFS